MHLRAQAEARGDFRPNSEHDPQRHADSAAEDALIKAFDDQAAYLKYCIAIIHATEPQATSHTGNQAK